MILWTDRIVFSILYHSIFVSLCPKNSFTESSSWIWTSRLICNVNGLPVSTCSGFLMSSIFEQILVFPFLFILGKQNVWSRWNAKWMKWQKTQRSIPMTNWLFLFPLLYYIMLYQSNILQWFKIQYLSIYIFNEKTFIKFYLYIYISTLYESSTYKVKN